MVKRPPHTSYGGSQPPLGFGLVWTSTNTVLFTLALDNFTYLAAIVMVRRLLYSVIIPHKPHIVGLGSLRDRESGMDECKCGNAISPERFRVCDPCADLYRERDRVWQDRLNSLGLGRHSALVEDDAWERVRTLAWNSGSSYQAIGGLCLAYSFQAEVCRIREAGSRPAVLPTN